MAELRWNPILKDWTMVNSSRQSRPAMPKDWCPFCPGSGRVPADYQVLRYPNDFPVLGADPPAPDDVASEPLFRVAPSYGRCEVLLYSPDHHGRVADLDDGHIHKLSALWREVFEDMRADPRIKYVFIFENKGEVVGVTMPHPHGQAYGYSWLPKTLERELSSALEYQGAKGSCLFCDLLAAEVKDARRIVFQGEHFTAYVPFFGNVTYGVHITANRHVPHLGAMSRTELDALGKAIRAVNGLYDCLFDTSFPYMMCMHNAPVNTRDDAAVEAAFHFHVEFIPPMRAANLQQFFASSETGAGAWCNPNCPEDKAAELRAAYEKYLKLPKKNN